MKHRIIPESVFSRPKVQKQLITIFLIVLIIPVLFSLFMLKESNKTLGRHYQEQVEAESQRVKSVMFDVTTNLYNVADNLASDDELLDILIPVFSQVPKKSRHWMPTVGFIISFTEILLFPL